VCAGESITGNNANKVVRIINCAVVIRFLINRYVA
jgi:hypothetical protein